MQLLELSEIQVNYYRLPPDSGYQHFLIPYYLTLRRQSQATWTNLILFKFF